MKYAVILGDGMADVRYAELGDRTPLEAAATPCADALARRGEVGLVQTVPPGMKPGSDVANLSVLGYDPARCYSGRSPLEAVSMGVELRPEDVTYRCNLVTLSDEPEFADKTMVDYSAGEISTAEAGELIAALSSRLSFPQGISLFAGVSYRHCLRWRGARPGATELTPPHDISDRKLAGYLPAGENAAALFDLMRQSERILKDHPVNLARIAAGKRPATCCWFWGEGTKPALADYLLTFGVRGAVISAVDLIKGIAKLAGMESVDVPGATGNIHTNFAGKAQAAIDCFAAGKEFVYVHLEAPDECGHQGQLAEKVRAIELIDAKILTPIVNYLRGTGEDFAVLFLPDHPTPVKRKTHTGEAVPYLLYRSAAERDNPFPYSEEGGRQSGLFVPRGCALIPTFLAK